MHTMTCSFPLKGLFYAYNGYLFDKNALFYPYIGSFMPMNVLLYAYINPYYFNEYPVVCI